MSSIDHPDMDRPIRHSHRVPNRFGTSVSARSTPPQKHLGETWTKASHGRRPAFRILFVNTHQMAPDNSMIRRCGELHAFG